MKHCEHVILMFSEQTDYSLVFYVNDVCLLITCIIYLFLDVNMEQTGENVWKSLKQIISIPAITFFGLCFLMGFQWGIHDTYLLIYLDEEMGASTEFISKR